MKKPYEYYIEKIHQTYPELKRLFGNYERIQTNINAEIAAGGTGRIAAKELYNLNLATFIRLAKFYAENELDHKTFEDAMSNLYLIIMEFINKRLEKGKWFKNVISYSTDLAHVTDDYFKKIPQIISNKYYLTSGSKQSKLISKIKLSNEDKEFCRIQIDREKDWEWLEQTVDAVATAQPDDFVSRKFLQTAIEDILETLKPKEKSIVISIFGFEDGVQKSLREVAEKFNLSRERIRQILLRALRKLRYPSKKMELTDFVM